MVEASTPIKAVQQRLGHSRPNTVLIYYARVLDKSADSAASLTTKPSCATTASSSSPVMGSPYVSSCGGAVDPNYAITYAGGSVTVTTAGLTITASSGS